MRSVKFKDYRWESYILASINSEEWQDRWDVEDRLSTIIPPEAAHRGFERWTNGQTTPTSWLQTIIGAAIRRLMRNGYVERTVPIGPVAKNLGTYSLRLTKKGTARRVMIRQYFCKDCFNTGLTSPKNEENVVCGHCRSRHVTITKL